MPAPRRKALIASRRRRQDDGEEEDSLVGDFDDDSLSEASAISNGDGIDAAGSDSSDDGQDSVTQHPHPKGKAVEQNNQSKHDALSPFRPARVNGTFNSTADNKALLYEVRNTEASQPSQEIHLDNIPDSNEAVPVNSHVAVPTAPRNETFAQRARREHQEYIQQRNTNPAFVPNRGGFFLHDDRSTGANGPSRPVLRGRGRGYNSVAQAGRGFGLNEPTEKPWAHDLHERHEAAPKTDQSTARNPADSQEGKNEKSLAPSAPNRSFSFVTVRGNVTVQVSLPGMEHKKLVSNVVKRQHTLLPQHRPPLRRDKPVRVSIPDEAPRYIFPSTERSFIFIPRALRPNQQYGRGRGRGSFHGSRRPSMYGSAYTPSVAMSRKSSLGGSTMRDGLRSPAESVMSRMGMPGVEAPRPIVRMPSAVPTPSLSRSGLPLMNGNASLGMAPNHMIAPTAYGSHSTSIPMHQPRPQKTVSVADIESPTSFPFKAPLQQLEQPFHQQVPPHMEERHGQPQAMVTAAGHTPLSQIPEGAIYAPGFQPYLELGQPAYFGPGYNNGPVFYPPVTDGAPYGVPMGGPALPPSFVPGSQAHHVGYLPNSTPLESGIPANMVAHESNGMVYYYNPPMFTPGSQGAFPLTPNPHMVPMGNGMPGQQPYHYSPMPAGMFYQGQTG
ncbi:uncharacterized protein A1O9_00504 [Exophiala aquamarina CBS 119918]|uniref:Btz domain-containing protein n=1 Tax=Exophiala aquamarina CBS 119918 TaxID=1182545 RepID=A0A072PRN0_9EURO|nr:uncharacterized protein A1O9_00504 [Exophiala aquamarina CBS 119918]KEF62531.1 hypothetical protein A1O9_00504 [Exophiala aquamarina CBS 119918]